MKSYNLVVSTPDGNVFEGDASMLTLRGSEGELAILAGHIPFITAVKPCECVIVLPDDSEKTAQIGGGILTVTGEKTTLLSSSFSWN